MPVSVAKLDTLWTVKSTLTTVTPDDDIVGGPVTIYSIHAVNSHAAIVYIWIYDHLNPTVATTAEDYKLFCASSGSFDMDFDILNPGVKFTTGLSVAASLNDDGTGAPSSGIDLSFTVGPV